MDLLRHLRFPQRLAVLIAILSLGFLVYGLWSFRTLEQLKVNGPLYHDVILGKDLIADVLPPPLYIIESYLVSLQLAAADNQIERDDLTQRLRALQAQQQARERFWAQRALDRNVATVLQQSNHYAAAFYEEAFAELVPALTLNQRSRAAQALLGMKRNYELHRRVVDNLVTLAASRARYTELQAEERIRVDTLLQLLFLTAALGLGIGVAVMITRSITQPLDEAVELAHRIGAGDLHASATSHYDDEPGQLLIALDEMKQSLAATAAAREESEQGMQRARALTDLLFNSANVLVLAQGWLGEVLIFNEAAAIATGCPRDRALGRIWRDLPLLPLTAVAQWPEGGRAEQFRQLPRVIEHSVMTPSGDERRIAWQNTVLEEGSIALVSIGIDVTELRHAERAMAAAREQADAANRGKAAFLSTISHELRTPMNAILGLTQLTLQGELDERQRRYLEQVDGAAHSLLSMVNDVLDFSRIEAGKLSLELAPVRLYEMLTRLQSQLQNKAREKGLELDCSIGTGVPPQVVGDPLRLQQLLQQLLVHAIGFTDAGKVTLSVMREDGHGDSSLLRFDVLHTSAELAPEAAVRLFEPLAHGGAGLGLSIARHLATLMGGHLVLESAPGGGNRFSFTALFRHAGGAPAAADHFPAMRAAGIDVASALSRVQGNPAQLRQQLQNFRRGHAGVVAELQATLARGDTELAHRLAHKLHGEATLLGAPALQQASAQLRSAIDNGNDPAPSLAALDTALAAVLAAIEADAARNA